MFAEIIRWLREFASRFAPPRPCPVPVRRPATTSDAAQCRELMKELTQRRKGAKKSVFSSFFFLPFFPSFPFFAPLRLCVSFVRRLRSTRDDGATAKRSPPSAFRLPPSAFTLVEMLVVITIMMILVAAAATMMQPGTESRRTRKAARMVNVYLSSARNRAMETGRPCGVIFRYFGTPGFAMNADQCEVPASFSGITETSTATITLLGNNKVEAVLSDEINDNSNLFRVGDVVQLNNQGPYYAITSDTSVDGEKYVNNSTLTLSYDSGQLVPWTTTSTPGIPFRIFRAPMKGAATPLQLPAGSVVDLQWSGSGSGYFGSDSAFTSTVNDVTILFSPNGSVDRVYTGQGYQPVTEPIFLLIGNRERVGQYQADPKAENKSTWANWQDLETGLWVTINPNTGVINTEPVAAGTTYDEARKLAREAKGMGGR